MFGLILILLLTAVGVAVLLAAGTAMIQGYLYSEPADGLEWRAPAAGAAMGVFFALWCLLEARAPGQYDTLLNFSTRETKAVDRFWSERVNAGVKQEIPYRKSSDDRGRVIFVDPDNRPWRRSDNGQMTALIIEEDGERKRFEAELNPDGTFRVEPNQPLRYVEVGGGRVMTENSPGEITATRTALLIGNLLLNLAHLLAWFGCFWLLLRFQWSHALGLALAFWLVFALVVWPVLQVRVKRAAAAQPVAAETVTP
jgi:hypothetical protein